MAGLRMLSMRTKLAVLCACAGALLIGMGMWKQQYSETAHWQPVNEQLAEALAAAEHQQSVVIAEGIHPSAEESGKAMLGTTIEINEAGASGAIVEPDSGSGVQQVDGVQTASENAIASKASETVSSAQTSPPAADGRLDLNRATAEQLDMLPGIGPAKAAAIINDRETSGLFKSVDDLVRVKGIGPAIVEKLRDLVVAQP
ncbi:ComEA family DNA-binding protein [Paenibacillus xylaniclasticus]|uniref:ComEA family DNA-binding protein n=1 Tax=Paenibacillus xylaniclasticus TaxID=588083 RepID=UPI001770B983|nr:MULTISPECIES: ComEA family DNA-binding protein [Paenibacillus]GFN30298.1 hypothetical protein PCURB6_05580 [Paenibacillus curdlanolyticus]